LLLSPYLVRVQGRKDRVLPSWLVFPWEYLTPKFKGFSPLFNLVLLYWVS
jgi:hypothetical protein